MGFSLSVDDLGVKRNYLNGYDPLNIRALP